MLSEPRRLQDDPSTSAFAKDLLRKAPKNALPKTLRASTLASLSAASSASAATVASLKASTLTSFATSATGKAVALALTTATVGAGLATWVAQPVASHRSTHALAVPRVDERINLAQGLPTLPTLPAPTLPASTPLQPTPALEAAPRAQAVLERAPNPASSARRGATSLPTPARDVAASTMLAELALIRQARLALQRGEPTTAEALLRAHESTFPDGALEPERLLLETRLADLRDSPERVADGSSRSARGNVCSGQPGEGTVIDSSTRF